MYYNCVSLAWNMESGVLNSIPSLGFASKNDINKHVWYSISSLVFNPNVGFESQAWYSIPMSPAGKGLTSWLSFVVSTVSLLLSHWYPGSGVVLDCIDS